MMDLFPWLFALALVVLAWWSALGAKTAARRAARAACRDAGVGFIDELALKCLTIGRDGHRRVRIKRVYGFEFYWSGERRHAGEVVMHGQRVAGVQLDPYPV